MVECSVGIRASGGVQGQQLVDQITSIGILDIWLEPFLDPPLGSLWNLHLAEEIHLLDPWPHLTGEGPTQLSDQGQLMLLCISLHDR